MCQRACPPLPHRALPDAPLSVPPPSRLLTFVTGARGDQGQQEGHQQEGHGVGQAGQGRGWLSPESPKPTYSTLGDGCRGSPRREGDNRQQGRLVHGADRADPDLGDRSGGLAGVGDLQERPRRLRSPASSGSLPSPPRPRYCRMTSAQPGGRTEPVANGGPGAARCCRGAGSQWDRGAGAGKRVRAFSSDCNSEEQGNCGGWRGSRGGK